MLRKILQIFTRTYKEETKYQEFLANNIELFKVNGTNESIDNKIDRLSSSNYVSNFCINYRNNL